MTHDKPVRIVRIAKGSWTVVRFIVGYLFSTVRVVIAIVVILAMVAGGLYLLWAMGQVILSMIGTAARTRTVGARVAVLVIIVAAAAAASLFKTINQVKYGAVEFVVALATGWRTASTLSGELATDAFVLVGTVYFAGRGLTNIIDGAVKRDKTSLRRWRRFWLSF